MGIRELNADEKIVFTEPNGAVLFHLPEHCAGCKRAINHLKMKKLDNWDIILVDAEDDNFKYLVDKYNIAITPTILVFENNTQTQKFAGLKSYLDNNSVFGE